MKYYDEYQKLYHEEEDYEYFEYVDNELKRIKRRYNERTRTQQRNN